MTSNDRTLEEQSSRPRLLLGMTTMTVLLSVVGVVVLALTHHPEAATTVGAIGTAMTAFNIPREASRPRQ
ncbi:hypothetical protein FBY35_3913 [Streptomyces sp. SLBN-118]|nr:hypothetical protein FBY35_3913 [Streptomyces sp. SLBN-118]